MNCSGLPPLRAKRSARIRHLGTEKYYLVLGFTPPGEGGRDCYRDRSGGIALSTTG